MTERFDVCIRGNGVVGKALALALAQQRLKVALVGRENTALTPTTSDVPGHSDVRAYALNAASRQWLEGLRAWPGPATPMGHDAASSAASAAPGATVAVTAVRRMVVRTDDGAELSFDASSPHAPLNWMVDVPALEAQLSQAVHFQPLIHPKTTADLPQVAATLTAVCEGRRSETRAAHGLDFEVKPYGHHALATRLRLPEPHLGVARQWLSQGQIVAFLPIGGEAGCDVAVVWSLPSERALALLPTCTTDPTEALNALAEVCGTTAANWHMLAPMQAWPLEWAEANRWLAPGVVLVGDAAHAMHPLAGQGLNVGLGDAAELARTLQNRAYWRSLADPKVLRPYERARKAAFAAMGGLTHQLFHLFQPQNVWLQQARTWGLSGVQQLEPIKRWLSQQASGQGQWV